MRIIGIIGGIASGKTWVAQRLEELGAPRIDADRAGHEALDRPEIREAIRARWGDAVFDGEGNVDRGLLAQIVFSPGAAGKKERLALERLVHPVITESLRRQIIALERSGKCVAVLDAPLLLEAGWANLCTTIVWVEAPRAMRIRRAAERGWSEAELASREAAQDSLDLKRRHADTVIDNSGNADHTLRQIERFWAALTAGRGRDSD